MAKSAKFKEKKPAVLVTGGAGYIGACTALCLKEAGYSVVVIDNLITGHKETVRALKVPFVEGDIGNVKLVRATLKKYKIQAVVHFAAHAYVGESVSDPSKYYLNNVGQSLKLFSAMIAEKVNTIVFSSTCATYGLVDKPIDENCQQNPINPYGRTKLVIEHVLKDYSLAYGLKWIAFRYFNVAGAHASLLVGERHNPETHLIPRTIFSTMGRPSLQLYGNDYPTPDGTCIRDYVHVQDIAAAHILGLEHLLSGKESCALNIGAGRGHSCLEIISAVEKITKKKVRYEIYPRRAGDPPSLVAASGKIERVLSWKPEFPGINEIVETAVSWYTKHPKICV